MKEFAVIKRVQAKRGTYFTVELCESRADADTVAKYHTIKGQRAWAVPLPGAEREGTQIDDEALAKAAREHPRAEPELVTEAPGPEHTYQNTRRYG